MKREWFVFVLTLVLFFSTILVSAADCGGDVACNCGDYLIASRILNSSDNLTDCSSSAGIYFYTGDITLDCNGFLITGDSSGIGINLDEANNLTIKNCRIYNFDRGIVSLLVSNLTIENTTITNSASNGIEMNGNLDNNSLVNVSISSSGSRGFLFSSRLATVSVSNSNFFNNTDTGLYLQNFGVVFIENVSAYSNGEEGIYVEKANASIIDSNSYNNTRDGIYFYSEGRDGSEEISCTASVKNTSTYYNGASGITYGNYLLDINSSRVYNNTYNGINIGYDSSSSDPQYKLRLTDSNITNNGQDGIFARYITEDSSYNISNNRVCGNLGAGAQVDSSCPFVFGWNGSGYQFVNDAFPLGKLWFLEEVPWIIKILVKIGILNDVPGIRDTTYNKLPFPLEEINGKYQLKVREQYDERSYFDSMSLMIIDHSPEYEVYPNRYGDNIITTSKNVISPVSCLDNYGNDCLSLIKEQDNNVKKLRKNDYVIINFGNLSYAEKIKMIISKGAVGAQNVKKFEVKDKNGNWVEADYKLGEIVNLYGFPTTQNVLELTNLFETSDFEIKIFAEDLPFLNREFDERLMIDYIGVDTSSQRNDFKITTLKPVSATLSSVNLPGFWSETKIFEGNGYQLPEYYESPTILKKNITEEISDDDCNMVDLKNCKTQVVMNFGDEINAEYDIPLLEAGMERDFIVITNGAYEKLPSSGHTDIFISNGYSISGSDNTCDTTWNYNDTGFSGCANSCGLTYFAGGDGSLENPYQIETCQQLQYVTYNLTANYVLNNNINCSNTTSWNFNYLSYEPPIGDYYRGFVPIGAGHANAETNSNPFTGIFDGDNYNITGLYINSYDTDMRNYNYIGLFGIIGSGAVVKNLGLVDVNISGGYESDSIGGTGGLAGYSTGDSTINNTFTTGNVSGVSFVGGLVGAHDYDPGTCFAAGTKILLEDKSYKNIEDIKVGDVVESYNEITKEKLSGKVVNTFEHIADSYLVVNNKLQVTPNHLLFVEGKWIEAGELKIGDSLFDENNNQIKVYSIVSIYNPIKVYNFEVNSQVESEEYCGPGHSYYAEGFLAHNKCPRVYTNNGTSYEFDSLLSVYHIGKHKDGIFNYTLKNFNSSVIRVDYDPNEINYLDMIEIHAIDSALNKPNKTQILKPISCNPSDKCDLNLLSGIDNNYLVLDENNTEIFLDFGSIPEIESGYTRSYLIVSKGYSDIIHPFKVSDFPDYIQKWLRGYNEFLSQGKHHTILNSYSTCNVTGTNSYAGGLVGYNVGTINNSYATGVVNGEDYAGGFVGYSELGSISRSYATGDVSGGDYVGGFAGATAGFVSGSYSLGNVETESAGSNIGGFAGYNGGGSFINNSYSRGEVSDLFASNYVGGFVGQNPGDIYSCYSAGDVRSEGNYIGGFAGLNAGDSIYSSYAAGILISERTGNVGGFIGSSPNDYINCGWVTTDSASVAIGYDSGVEGSVEFITYNESSFEAFYDVSHEIYTSGENGDVWDFTNVWSDVYDGRDFPVFKWQSGGISFLRLNIVSPSNGVTDLSPVSFVFNPSMGLDAQEVEYCNLTAEKLRISEIESSESDLLALWNFNGDLTDSSGNGNDGTANGGDFNFTNYKFGNASYSLDGTQDILLPGNSVFTSIGNFTISAWVKINDNVGFDSILAFGSAGDDFLFDINNRKVNFYTNSVGSVYGNTLLSLNRWYNVVAVREGNIVSFYVNGVDDGISTLYSSDPIILGNGFRAIGGDIPGGSDDNFDGSLDEIAIWNRSFSASEVSALYSSQYKNSSASIVEGQDNSLSLNLSNGNYSWNMQCTDNTGLTKTTKARSLTVNGTQTVDEENQTITNNQTTYSSYSPQTFYTDSNLPSVGNNFNMFRNDKIKFIVHSVNHTLTLGNFNSSTARVVIQSNPITAYLQKGTLYEFDLNNDSVNDVKARYNGMNKTKAMIFIQEIIQPQKEGSVENTAVSNEVSSNVEAEDLGYSDWKVYFFAIAIILLILFVVWKKFENKIKEYFWVKGIERSRLKNKSHQYYP